MGDRPFRNQAQAHHLTYKGLVNPDDWFAHFKERFPLKRSSFVHEKSDKQNPYEHTHIFVEHAKPFDSRDCHVFDFDDVHCNITNVVSQNHKKEIVVKYHHKAPLTAGHPIQVNCSEWLFCAEAWDVAEAHSNVRDGCVALGIQPRSISDVESIVRTGKKRKPASLEGWDDVDPKRFKPIPWDRKTALLLKGPPSHGKTPWAIHQFQRPQLISHLDDLKGLPDDCDGLVFDETLYAEYSKALMVGLLDLKTTRSLQARNTCGRIPVGMPRIFVCNDDEQMFGDNPMTGGHRAVTKRYKTILLRPGERLWI